MLNLGASPVSFFDVGAFWELLLWDWFGAPAKFAKSFYISGGNPPSAPGPPENKSLKGSEPELNPGKPAFGSLPYFSYIYFIKSGGGCPNS